MGETDQCPRCGGDCPMTRCPECGGCENTGPGGTFRECPACVPDIDPDDIYDDLADGADE